MQNKTIIFSLVATILIVTLINLVAVSKYIATTFNIPTNIDDESSCDWNCQLKKLHNKKVEGMKGAPRSTDPDSPEEMHRKIELLFGNPDLPSDERKKQIKDFLNRAKNDAL
tara:strand:+ start:431 stop:766 length:336 start_codon:yes stop_codon:yes gene_type:complete